MPGPLSHIRVLDLSRVLAGPWAAQNLADLGAEVIKVERPGTGDDTRGWGPPFLKRADGGETRETAYFLCANRGKKSLTVDLAHPRGQALARALAARSDVLIENFRAGGAARFGLGYDDLAPMNPGLVYCSITGFGQAGPYRDRPSYDFIVQAMGGLMSLTGEADDRPGGGPQRTGVAITDLFTGLYAAVAIQAALLHRERTGEGQYIDLALLDATVSMLSMAASNYFVSSEPPRRRGNTHLNVAPYQLFPTRDGHVVLVVGNDGQFARYADVLGRPELAEDPRFRTNSARVENREVLDEILLAAMRERSSGEWIEACAKAGVPCAPVNDVAQVFADPQVAAREMKVTLPHSAAGTAEHAGNPMRLSRTPVAYTRSAPLLGEHTDEVLGGLLGLDRAAIAELRAEGVI